MERPQRWRQFKEKLKERLLQPKRSRFQVQPLLESSEPLNNPGCGWYHLYSFALTEDVPALWIACPEESLVLLRIDIGAFREREIPEKALACAEQILTFFVKEGKDMILRFVYDTEGRGIAREPAGIRLVKRHMEQLGPLISRQAEHVLAVQGLLVGSWGEMHGSKFLSPERMTELAETMAKAMDYRCPLAVRKPVQWRIIASRGSEPLKQCLTLFNDAMFGSETDLGTYSDGTDQVSSGCENRQLPAPRREELSWQQEQMKRRFCGGEVLAAEGSISGQEDGQMEKAADKQPVSWKRASDEMKQMHTSYLNSVWQPEQLDFWKQETAVWPGTGECCSGYEYIGRHLGYRFIVRSTNLDCGSLKIVIENCGFANFCGRAECILEAELDAEADVSGLAEKRAVRSRISSETEKKEESRKAEQLLIADKVSEWDSGTETKLQILIPKHWLQYRTKLYLKLERTADRRPIHFGNQTADGTRVWLGTLIPG